MMFIANYRSELGYFYSEDAGEKMAKTMYMNTLQLQTIIYVTTDGMGCVRSKNQRGGWVVAIPTMFRSILVGGYMKF